MWLPLPYEMLDWLPTQVTKRCGLLSIVSVLFGIWHNSILPWQTIAFLDFSKAFTVQGRYKRAEDLWIYDPIVSCCKQGFEYFCVLAKVTQKSGQNLGLDLSSRSPSSVSCSLVCIIDLFKQRRLCGDALSVPGMIRVGDIDYPSRTFLEQRKLEISDDNDIW